MTTANDGEPTSEMLMAEATLGGETAFEALYRRHVREVLDFAFRMTHDRARAEEIGEEVFVRVFQYGRSYSPSRPFRPWLHAIVRRCIRGVQRKRPRAGPLPPEAFEGAPEARSARGADPVTATMSREEKARLHNALLDLADDAREVVVLHLYQGLTFPEVAHVVDSTPDACRMRYARALLQLRRALG